MTIITASCSGNDDNETAMLEGNWYLAKIECYCVFDPSIDIKDFTLSFETKQNVVYIDNPTEDYFYISRSGSHAYILEGNILKVEDAEPYTFEVKGANMILTRIDDPGIADDELVLYYEKR